ncbi:MAG: hypothetical protein ACT4PM_06985 [Gemmatimonadales bacterium]
MNRIWRTIGVVQGLLGFAAEGSAQQSEAFTLPNGKICRISEGSQQEIKLGEEYVIVQPDAIHWPESRLLILGGSGTTYRTNGAKELKYGGRIAGVLVEPDGTVTPIPMVTGPTDFSWPHVVEDHSGGWHVVFNDTIPGTSGSKRIWYAHLKGTKWTEVDSVFRIPDRSPVTGNLAVLRSTRTGGLAFAVGVELAGRGDGIVAAILEAGRWRIDTLIPSRLTSYFDLWPTQRGITIAGAMAPLAVPDAPMGLYLVDSTESGWHTPRLLVEKPRGSLKPAFFSNDSQVTLAWQLSGSSRRVDSASLWSARMDPNSTLGVTRPTLAWQGVANGMEDPEFVQVGEVGLFALLREPRPDSAVKLVSIDAGDVVNRVTIPASTFRLAAVGGHRQIQIVLIVVRQTELGNMPYMVRIQLPFTCSLPKGRGSPQ